MRTCVVQLAPPATSRRPIPGELWVLLGALLWSTAGVAIKYLVELSPLAISGARSLIAAVLFAALMGGGLFDRRHWRTVIPGALFYCAVVTLYVVATKWTTAANAVILQYTAPLWIAALSWPLLKEKPTIGELLCLAAGFGGVVLCVADGFRFSLSEGLTMAMLGDLIGLVSGLAFGLLILTLRGSSRVDAATGRRINWQILVYGNLLAALIGMPALAGEAVAGKLDFLPLLVLLWMGTGQLSFGYLAFQAGIRTTPALRASIISLAEPVLNPVLVFLIVGEVVTSGTIYGGTIVLVALLIAAALPKAKPA